MSRCQRECHRFEPDILLQTMAPRLVRIASPGSFLFVGALCNGSTTDFDSVSLGSIPNAPAKYSMVSLV